MAKGIIYVCSTAVDGLIKIGKTENFEKRMAQLEGNGYRNVAGLKRQFAIEVDNYSEIEDLLDDLFEKSKVGTTELFSLDLNKVIQLLSSFNGTQIYPANETKEEVFEKATEAVQSGKIPDGTYTLDVKTRGENVHAQGTMVVACGKLKVLKGAVLAPLTERSNAGWIPSRNSLRTQSNVTLDDFEATSPSMAASIICGHNKNGWSSWKNSKGEYIDVYRQYEEDEDEE